MISHKTERLGSVKNMELQTIKRPARAVFHSPFQQKLSPLTLGMALLYLGERFKLIQSLFPLTVIIFSASYILWRLWTFTISPALRPKEPKLVPYLVPGKQIYQAITLRLTCSGWGHASWLLRDQIGLFKYGRFVVSFISHHLLIEFQCIYWDTSIRCLRSRSHNLRDVKYFRHQCNVQKWSINLIRGV